MRRQAVPGSSNRESLVTFGLSEEEYGVSRSAMYCGANPFKAVKTNSKILKLILVTNIGEPEQERCAVLSFFQSKL